jgi:hypothetical protein
MMHCHLLKIDDKPARKFIALQQAGWPWQVITQHAAVGRKRTSEISDAATPSDCTPTLGQTKKNDRAAIP